MNQTLLDDYKCFKSVRKDLEKNKILLLESVEANSLCKVYYFVKCHFWTQTRYTFYPEIWSYITFRINKSKHIYKILSVHGDIEQHLEKYLWRNTHWADVQPRKYVIVHVLCCYGLKSADLWSIWYRDPDIIFIRDTCSFPDLSMNLVVSPEPLPLVKTNNVLTLVRNLCSLWISG